jgi:hypothetical protein
VRPTVYVPGRWIWGAVKAGAWFIALGIAAAHNLGGWFIGGSVGLAILRRWASHGPVVEVPPAPESGGLTVEEVRALLRLAEAQRVEPSEPEPPQRIEAKRDR